MVNPVAGARAVPALRLIIADLADEFAGTFSRETVERCVLDSELRLTAAARITSFIPILSGRFARERLQAAGQREGSISKTMPEVLFVCVHNAGRSQMAAGLTHVLSGGKVNVRSAGSEPADQINPAVVEAMAELGIDISHEFPKPLTDEVVEAADVVITMGCGDACPIYPGTRYLDWQVDDPAGQPLEKVRAIRDDIRGRVEGLLRELDVPVMAR
ncbi:MAG: arsenate reductase ArsC [Dehalococcoidia bacterium]